MPDQIPEPYDSGVLDVGDGTQMYWEACGNPDGKPLVNLHGGSRGCTLALSYAQQFAERVSAMILVSVTTTRRSEIEWLYHGVGRFFPDAWRSWWISRPCSRQSP